VTGWPALLARAAADLRAAGVEAPMRDARLLAAHALAVPPDRLVLALADPVAPAAAAAFAAAVARRAAREPLSHVTGRRQFWGRWFAVSPAVLDPRPETETLVAAALGRGFERVLDLGTGSGAILLSLLADRPAARGTGTDLSAPALAVARANAGRLGVGARAELVQGDWFAPVSGRFDLIVSNPPYIPRAEVATLAPEVRLWEPHLALTPGDDGLGAYRVLAAGAAAHLAPGGALMLEIGPTQAAAVGAILRAQGFARLSCLPDLDGRDRVIVAEAG
jgi:release factor glutamine methyltransferase